MADTVWSCLLDPTCCGSGFAWPIANATRGSNEAIHRLRREMEVVLLHVSIVRNLCHYMVIMHVVLYMCLES